MSLFRKAEELFEGVRRDSATGAPLPHWAQPESTAPPEEHRTVIYPGDARLTDGQHSGLDSVDEAAKSGVVVDRGATGLLNQTAQSAGIELESKALMEGAAPTPEPTPDAAPAAPDEHFAQAEPQLTPEERAAVIANEAGLEAGAADQSSAGDSEPPVVESTSDSAA